MKTNREALARALHAREYGCEVTKEIEQIAKENNLVIVFGASDDLTEFRGAIHDEMGCYEGGAAYITKDGLLEECECDCKHYKFDKKRARKIKAIWSPSIDLCWDYETDIPHSKFVIYEDGESYCRGIVFSLDDL